MESDIAMVTAEAPVNIAVIKYWGKRDEKLILPVNGSISATLDLQHLRAKTTVAASRHFTADRIWLNGIEQSINNSRLQSVLQEIRRRARKRRRPDDVDNSAEQLLMLGWKVHICSENNFPTAAGLASSAAGLACLVFSLSKLYKISDDVSDIARLGSGSACRSMYGGFVEWICGVKDDGADSVARQIVTEHHWPDMRILVLVVNTGKKHVGSTDAMQSSVVTSELLKHRADHIVPRSLDEMKAAILDRNFNKFAELTMKDSNQMHAICLDTLPPVVYLTDTSHNVIRLVHAINKHFNENKVAYTFDAGPNACLYLLKENVEMVLGLIRHFFPPTTAICDNGQSFVTGLPCETFSQPSEELLTSIPIPVSPGAVKYVIHTQVGQGPRVLTECTDSLLNTETGQPLSLKS